MKKCSRSAHHTLTELNITPLLDLAFVLLVIFIITTTPIVNDLDLNYITVDAAGGIYVNKKLVELAELQPVLAGLRVEDPDLNVILRGDGKTEYRRIRAVLDACQQANVAKLDLATDPIR